MGAKGQDVVRGGTPRGELLAAGGCIEHSGIDRGELLGVQGIEAVPSCQHDELSPEKIDFLLRKWLAILPHPFSPQDRKAGYCYDLSILQADFSLTQVLSSPMTGRIFFEQVLRENLDVGRPDKVQLIFNRRITKRTPGRFRTRVLSIATHADRVGAAKRADRPRAAGLSLRENRLYLSGEGSVPKLGGAWYAARVSSLLAPS